MPVHCEILKIFSLKILMIKYWGRGTSTILFCLQWVEKGIWGDKGKNWDAGYH